MSALDTITTGLVWGIAVFAFIAGLFIPLMTIGALMTLKLRSR